MEKFIPYSRLSKKKKKELDKKARRTWGNISPVTRCAPPPKAYSRAREKQRAALFSEEQ